MTRSCCRALSTDWRKESNIQFKSQRELSESSDDIVCSSKIFFMKFNDEKHEENEFEWVTIEDSESIYVRRADFGTDFEWRKTLN